MGLAITVFQTPDYSTVELNDIYSGQVTQSNEELLNENGKFGNPVYLSGNRMVAIASSDGQLWMILRNPDNTVRVSRVALPAKPVTDLVVVDGASVGFVGDDNAFYVLNLSTDGSAIADTNKLPLPLSYVTNVVLQTIDANHFVCLSQNNAGNMLCYFTQNTVLTAFAPQGSGYPIGPFCLSGQFLYFWGDDGTSYFIRQCRIDDPNFVGWTTFINGGDDSTPVSNLEISGNKLYFGYGDGTFRSMNLDTGAMSVIPVPNDEGFLGNNKLLIDEGIAYLTIPNGKVTAVDLASNGLSSVSYDFRSLPYALTIPVGVENGLLVVLTAIPGTNGAFVGYAGVDLSSVLKGYSCDSVLMAEDYTAGGTNGYMAANPGYRTVVHMVDENKMPRVNTQVRIEATDTVTITTDDGVSTTLTNPGDAVWLSTDEAGDLHFVSSADDIQSPSLMLWAAFMDPTESIVIYPDHVSINKLAAAQGSDYQTATSFDGTPLIPSNVNIDHGQLAQTVSGLLGTGSTVQPPQSLSAYPSSDTNMSYQNGSSSATRNFNAGSAQSFTTVINDDGSISYAAGASFDSVSTKQLQGLLSLSFSDFKKDVVKGAKKLKKLAIKIGQDIEHEITAIDGTIYQFVVKTIEDAIGVVTGLFKTIFADIKKAIEWLSSIFDWGAIKQAHTQILGMVDNFRTNVRGYLAQDATTLKTALSKYFTDAESNVQGFFGTVGGGMGTFQSQQTNGSDPKSLYGNNGSYAQSQSMHSKAKHNIRKATKWSGPPNSSPLTVPNFLTSFRSLIETQIPSAISSLDGELASAFKDFKQSFGDFASNPGGAMKHAITDLFAIIGDLVVLLLKGANLAFDLIIDLLADMLDTLVNVVTGGIEIPILGPLFKLIFGRDLTFMDLIAWMIAVPVSIISKIANVSSGLLGENSFQLIAWGVATGFGGIIDALCDAVSPAGNDPLAILDLTCAVFSFGLGTPSSFPTDATICYYAFGVIPMICSFANITYAWLFSEEEGPEAEAAAQEFATKMYVITGFYGLLNMGAAVFNGIRNPKEFSDPNGSVLAQNVFSNFGLMMKMIYSNSPQAVVVTDVACPMAAVICGVVANA